MVQRRARSERAASSSARCSITSSASAAIALTGVPPSMRPMFVLASPRGCRLSARAMRHTSSIALGRRDWPRSGRRARAPDARAQAAHRVDGDVQQAMALERERQLGLQVAQAVRAPARLPSPSSPTVNATARPASAALSGGLLDDLHGARRPRRRCRRSRARASLALEHGLVRDVAREHRVHVREQEHAGRPGSKRQIRCRQRRRPPPGAARAAAQPRDRSPSSNVGAGTRASPIRSSRASSAAFTPRDGIRPRCARLVTGVARPEGRRGFDRRIHVEAEIARLGDQHHVLDGILS